jgi:hypothetical protein
LPTSRDGLGVPDRHALEQQTAPARRIPTEMP